MQRWITPTTTATARAALRTQGSDTYDPAGLLVTKMGSVLTCLPNTQYDALMTELRALRADNVQIDYLKAENQRLRTLLHQYDSLAHVG